MKKVSFIYIMFAFAVSVFGQTENLNDKLKFGFNAGVNYSNLLVTKSATNIEEAQVSNNPGGRMGIIVDYEIAKHFSFSPKAEMSFNTGKISLTKMGDEKQVYNVLPITIELSSHVNYKIKTGKLVPYVTFGPCFKIPLIDEKSTAPQMTKSSDVALDFGIGLDKMLSSFNFAPELRYSFGLITLRGVNTISKLNFHSVSLLFNFKG